MPSWINLTLNWICNFFDIYLLTKGIRLNLATIRSCFQITSWFKNRYWYSQPNIKKYIKANINESNWTHFLEYNQNWLKGSSECKLKSMLFDNRLNKCSWKKRRLKRLFIWNGYDEYWLKSFCAKIEIAWVWMI